MPIIIIQIVNRFYLARFLNMHLWLINYYLNTMAFNELHCSTLFQNHKISVYIWECKCGCEKRKCIPHSDMHLKYNITHEIKNSTNFSGIFCLPLLAGGSLCHGWHGWPKKTNLTGYLQWSAIQSTKNCFMQGCVSIHSNYGDELSECFDTFNHFALIW